MPAVQIIPLDPGRYVVRGGPRGDTVTQRVMRDTGDGHALDHGRTVIRNTARDRWPILAAFKIRPGQHVTHGGALGAVMRVWELA